MILFAQLSLKNNFLKYSYQDLLKVSEVKNLFPDKIWW